MLSKNTRAGTRVVGIPAPPLESYIAEPYLETARRLGVEPDHEGQSFTVEMVVRCEAARCGFAVTFLDSEGIWPLECYRPAELPECLRSLLQTQPRDLEVV